MILPLKSKYFKYEHLFSNLENLNAIKNFYVAKQSGKGLERYIKNLAEKEEISKSNRTYLVKDKFSNEIAGYFSLRTGLFTIDTSTPSKTSLYSVSAIELSNFAVNSEYKKNHPEINKIGNYIFTEFILPIAKFVGEIVGVQALYIYALPEDDLIQHYAKMGFNRLLPEEEKFVHEHVKPAYDKDCIFMWQHL